MGIRFACHVCDKRLNIKQELAGKRGVCPGCSSRIRIPLADAEKSTPVEVKQQSPVAVQSGHSGGAADDQAHHVASHEELSDQELSDEVLTDRVSGGSASALAVAAGEVSSAPASRLSSQSPAIDLLESDPDATWYVRPPSGGQYGPATSDVLRQWIGEGRVATSALLWRDGWPQWREALEVFPELSGRLPEGNVRSAEANIPAFSPDSSSSRPSDLTGGVDLGAAQKSRWSQRMMAIGLLSFLAITLIVVLVIVAAGS